MNEKDKTKRKKKKETEQQRKERVRVSLTDLYLKQLQLYSDGASPETIEKAIRDVDQVVELCRSRGYSMEQIKELVDVHRSLLEDAEGDPELIEEAEKVFKRMLDAADDQLTKPYAPKLK